jgi:hypothetical protein
MKYIFITGAPGSTWSGVAKRIYWSPDIDHSDYSAEREYYGSSKFPAHTGAYFDPGFEFSLDELDKPFDGTGIKLIKSHTISLDLDKFKEKYPDCPIVMIYRPWLQCFRWWQEAGGWDITYPDYRNYYRPENNNHMMWHCDMQNRCILDFVENNKDNIIEVSSPLDINNVLGIRPCMRFNPIRTEEDLHDIDVKGWMSNDIKIYIYKP